MNPEIQKYIQDARANGQNDADIRATLINTGWDASVVDENMGPETFNVESTPSPVEVAPNTPPPYQPPVEEGRGGLPVFKILGALVFVAILGAGGYFGYQYYQSRSSAGASPTPQQTSEVKTKLYRNDTFGFEMQIPEAWTVREDRVDDELTLRFLFGEEKNLPTGFYKQGDYFTIRIFPVTDETNYADYTDYMAEAGKSSVKLSTVGGLEAYDTGTHLGVQHNGYVFQFYPPINETGDGNSTYTDQGRNLVATVSFF